MGKTIRLTTAQALVKFLTRQMTMVDGKKLPIFAGVWAIFGHGNVVGIGEALFGVRKELPTYRAHNEQAMAHAAIAFAKASRRRRMMACTSSIGPGALNMVTAAAVAHVNRVPLLLLPGDVFANRLPDPVLQQVEDFGDGTVSVNDCFKPVSRYFDRIATARTTDPRAEPRHGGFDRPRRLRPGDACHVPGHPGRGLRLSRKFLRGKNLDHAPHAPRRRRAGGSRPCTEGCEKTCDHRGRRRALFRSLGHAGKICRPMAFRWLKPRAENLPCPSPMI